MNKQKILIVDDDENIAELVSLYLTKECFDTMMVHDGERALVAFDTYKPNLILLDLMLPGIDGYQVCREIRTRSNTPIIMLSAKGEVFDKVLGLELGADDYIMKPFDAKELVARVKAVLRRYQVGSKPETPQADKGKCVEYPGIEINLLGKTVDEAIAELDKYLDDASLAHLSSVRIVHGKGTGALRAGIHKYLKRQKHVKSFRLGAFGEGDAGVTIAELK